MTVPDPDLRFDEETGHYRFGEIDCGRSLTR